MDRRIFLRALSEMRRETPDWRAASDSEVEVAWEKLRQRPYPVGVGPAGRLAIHSERGSDTREEASGAAPAPRFRVELQAYRFFDQLGGDVRDRLGVVLVDPGDLNTWRFAQLRPSIDEGNVAARSADIPVLFENKLSEAEKAWEKQVRGGKVVGMNDPVWMAKTQEQIDSHLAWQWHVTKGEQ